METENKKWFCSNCHKTYNKNYKHKHLLTKIHKEHKENEQESKIHKEFDELWNSIVEEITDDEALNLENCGIFEWKRH